MKWYMYRNNKTGQEIKTKEPACNDLGWDGYKLINTINLEVSAKERKAK